MLAISSDKDRCSRFHICCVIASAIFRIIKEVSVVGEAGGRQVTASSGKVEIASMGQPVESSFNKVVSIIKSILWHLPGVHCKKRFAIFLCPQPGCH
jgi:hypothetical protein